ncbi:MAG: chemotaxis protein CheA [Paenibacillaceae bacterium]|jgi:two-component system chemotaxis sensor kinase CheA|nr:chemotaxis protein CheA [Paenibacillaceae bacterium]
MEDLSAYREAFIGEMVDQLERMEHYLLHLEHDTSSDMIQSIFRTAHTIKGSSAAMGFDEMKSVTHEVEHLLDMVRSNKLQVGRSLVNLLFEALDHLKLLRDEYMGETAFSDIAFLLHKLRIFIEHKPSGEPPKGELKELKALTLEQSLRLEEVRETGCSILKVQLELSADCIMKGARYYLIMQDIQARFGAVLYSDPAASEPGAPFGDDAEEEQYSRSVFLIGTRESAEAVAAGLRSHSDVEEAAVELYQSSAPVIPKPSASAVKEQAAPEDKQNKGPQTIRVSVERLEHLMNLVGELLIDQTSLAQLKQSVTRSHPNEEFVERLGDISDHISRTVGELQDSVMKARMLPIKHLFQRFPRTVRDLSQKLGKDIELVLDGMETELDRTVIEEIGDPLIHLIRNAVDHGIEAADVRIASGKSAKGTVRLNSYHEDNQVIITVEDDGGGIRPEAILESALRKGVVTEEEAAHLSDQDAVYLIFRPGFSTAAQVSEVSGRGVGMDIVRSQIERLNGMIHIDSQPGTGTRFTIRLPLTLAIITGLKVKVSQRDYIIPMTNVVEIVRVLDKEIKTIRGQSVLVIRKETIPLVWLSDTLNYERPLKQKKHQPIVIVGSAEKKIALAVDELLGNQEVVIKTLGSYLGKIPYVAGAAILGNGRVALIAEISYFFQMMKMQ